MDDGFTETHLRKILIEWIADEFLVDEIHKLEPECVGTGEVIAVSEIIRRKYQARLDGLHRVVPLKVELHDQCRSVLRVLDECEPSEAFYYWETHSELWNYAGVATPKRVVEFSFSPENQGERRRSNLNQRTRQL